MTNIDSFLAIACHSEKSLGLCFCVCVYVFYLKLNIFTIFFRLNIMILPNVFGLVRTTYFSHTHGQFMIRKQNLFFLSFHSFFLDLPFGMNFYDNFFSGKNPVTIIILLLCLWLVIVKFFVKNQVCCCLVLFCLFYSILMINILTILKISILKFQIFEIFCCRN